MLPLWLLVVLFIAHVSNLVAFWLGWINVQRAAVQGFTFIITAYMYRIGQEIIEILSPSVVETLRAVGG